MLRLSLIAVVAASLLAACGKPSPDKQASPAAAAASAPSLLVAPEDVQTLGVSEYASGPVITGSIQPERRADLRAELQAVVLQVFKENGERVKRGDLLVRLDDTAIRDTVQSADEAARAASQSFEQAERQYQRLKTLQAQGMSSIQAMRTRKSAATTPRATWWPPAPAWPRRASSSSAPRCAPRSTASSATATSRRATRRRSARS